LSAINDAWESGVRAAIILVLQEAEGYEAMTERLTSSCSERSLAVVAATQRALCCRALVEDLDKLRQQMMSDMFPCQQDTRSTWRVSDDVRKGR
jgi:hypothetical protein